MAKKKPEVIPSTPYKALALKRNPEGKHWAIVCVTIQDGKVLDENVSNFDLLPYTMSKASSMLQDLVRELR